MPTGNIRASPYFRLLLRCRPQTTGTGKKEQDHDHCGIHGRRNDIGSTLFDVMTGLRTVPKILNGRTLKDQVTHIGHVEEENHNADIDEPFL